MRAVSLNFCFLIAMGLSNGASIQPREVSDEDFEAFLNLQTAVMTSNREDIKQSLVTVSDHELRLGQIETKLDTIFSKLDNFQNELSQLKTDTGNQLEAIRSQLSAQNTTVVNLGQKVDQISDSLAATNSNLNALKAAAVTDIRLSGKQATTIFRQSGYPDTAGYIITGITNHNSDQYVDDLSRRKVEKLTNGSWQPVSFV